MSLLLEGKRAFVSGGTRGIGAALCKVFAREGADVAFNYNSRDDLAEEVRGEIESYGVRSRAFRVSVTDRIELKRSRENSPATGVVSIYSSTTPQSTRPTTSRRRPTGPGIG
ncbi:MAG: SDR family NAD(P)-dependent oxidoreductase [Acidobacteriota bacterium]|nr:MAG: SDR family NAD(P)-dependent oxidoreductase [Acidobacteriota bacterium]